MEKTTNSTRDAKEVKEPGASMYLIGWAAAAIFLLIVGLFHLTSGEANVLGIFLFFASFGLIAKLNWEWFSPALDFDLEELGFGSTPMFLNYSKSSNEKESSRDKNTPKK